MSDPATALARADTVLCSACLLGEPCRFDGRDKRSAAVLAAIAGKSVVPVCPEVASGLGVPRGPCTLDGGDGAEVLAGRGRVISADGRDATSAFLRGARIAAQAARKHRATVAILKDKSPSCGSRSVWIGSSLQPGRGVTAAALEEAGITVVSSAELESSR